LEKIENSVYHLRLNLSDEFISRSVIANQVDNLVDRTEIKDTVTLYGRKSIKLKIPPVAIPCGFDPRPVYFAQLQSWLLLGSPDKFELVGKGGGR